MVGKAELAQLDTNMHKHSQTSTQTFAGSLVPPRQKVSRKSAIGDKAQHVNGQYTNTLHQDHEVSTLWCVPPNNSVEQLNVLVLNGLQLQHES